MNGEQFRAWRLGAELTQEQAAEKFNRTRVTIQNWEASDVALPDYVEHLTRIFSREIKKAREEVKLRLTYVNKPSVWVSSGPDVAIANSETFLKTSLMLRRVYELHRSGVFHHGSAFDEQDILIWDHAELVQEVKSPLPLPPSGET